MFTRRALVIALTAASSGLNVASFAVENYPKKTIKVIVPYPPGVPSEIIYRLLQINYRPSLDSPSSLKTVPVALAARSAQRPPRMPSPTGTRFWRARRAFW